MNENKQAAVAETTYLVLRELRRFAYRARLTENDLGIGTLSIQTPNGTNLTITVAASEHVAYPGGDFVS